MKGAVQTVSGDSPAVDMGADNNERLSSPVRVHRSMSANKIGNSSRYSESRMVRRLEGGDSFESRSVVVCMF